KQPDTQQFVVDRDSVVKNLDKMMAAAFPRTFESCSTFLQDCDWRGQNCKPSSVSFERSCGIAMDEILSGPMPGTNNLSTGDLDVLTILALAMEATIDTCNVQDEDDQRDSLHWSLVDGGDELDCGFVKAKDVVNRLMESKILQVKGVDSGVIKLMLDFTSATFITRPMGKVAMIRGQLSVTDLLWNELTFWAYRKGATVGSLYALISDIADSERARGIEKGRGEKARP
ncbi:MAG: hypothetical protein NDJ90_05755, partial [Oligoflexia bacterium]|nr:hypothetical protein [Oligoflexia bacterium]